MTQQYTSFIHIQFAVLRYAKTIGERLVDEMIEFLQFNLHHRVLLSLLLCGRGLYLLLRLHHMATKHPEVDAVWLLGQFLRLYHVVQHSDVSAPSHVLNCLPVRHVVN